MAVFRPKLRGYGVAETRNRYFGSLQKPEKMADGGQDGSHAGGLVRSGRMRNELANLRPRDALSRENPCLFHILEKLFADYGVELLRTAAVGRVLQILAILRQHRGAK